MSDKNLNRAEKIAQDIELIMQGQELPFSYKEDEGCLRGTAPIPGTESVISSVIDIDEQLLVFCCILPVLFTADMESIGAQALCMLNSILPAGCFYLENGRVVCRTSLTFRHSEVSAAALYDLVVFCRSAAGNHFILLQRLARQEITLTQFYDKIIKS